MNIIKKKTPHFTIGRAGLRPIGIVIHIMEGTLNGTSSWFVSPISKLSAHYGIGKKGEVYQWVDEKDTAQHAGIVVNPTWKHIKRVGKGKKGYVNPNLYTVGIEHEGKASDEWTPEMYQASAQLIAEIAARWDIPIDADHIIPHRAIRATKTCPGLKVDLDFLIGMAQGFRDKQESFSV